MKFLQILDRAWGNSKKLPFRSSKSHFFVFMWVLPNAILGSWPKKLARCKELTQIIKLKIDQLYPTLKNARKARPQNGQKGPKKIFFHNKHVIEWARNLENINIFPMAAHPSHPQSLKKQNPNFSFFSKTHLALDRFCKIKPQTAKMPSQTFINESDMLKTLQILDF